MRRVYSLVLIALFRSLCGVEWLIREFSRKPQNIDDPLVEDPLAWLNRFFDLAQDAFGDQAACGCPLECERRLPLVSNG